MKHTNVIGQLAIASGVCLSLIAGAASANPIGIPSPADNSCAAIAAALHVAPTPPAIYGALHTQLKAAVEAEPSGLKLDMWATLVDRSGVVCAVARSSDLGGQWPGSRIISAQKASTANAFSLPGLALSTANLYAAVQPGGSLFGLQASNPVDPAVAYQGPASNWGTAFDPLVGQRIGGVNVFGGGLALYNERHQLIGGLGLSGDTSCTDHFKAWRLRNLLGLDHLGAAVGGVAAIFNGDPTHPDNIIFDVGLHPSIQEGNQLASTYSPTGFGHPKCGDGTVITTGNPLDLPAVSP